MLIYSLLTLFMVGLGTLTLYRFRLAVQLLILLLPAYLVRFKIGPLPTTLLEVALGVVLLVWLVRFARQDFSKLKKFFCGHKIFTVALLVFLLASLTSIFRSDMIIPSLGQWRAYFLEPVLLFIVLLGRREEISVADLVSALGFSTVSVALFGIFQQFSGIHLPTNDGQVISDRVTSFFSSPNAVGLFVVPILMLLLPRIWKSKNSKGELVNRHEMKIVYVLIFSTNVGVLLLTKSVGALAALLGGIIIYLFFVGRKKLALTLAVIPVLIAVVVLGTAREAMAIKIKSGGNRLTLWNYSWEYLSASPDNFVFGAGIRQFFRKVQKPHYDAKKMERLIYPHNIALNFWTETGLLGLLGFAGIFACLVWTSLKLKRNADLRMTCESTNTYEFETRRVLAASFLAALGAFLIHGMIDVPYFKNDLAMLFWVFAAIVLVQSSKCKVKSLVQSQKL